MYRDVVTALCDALSKVEKFTRALSLCNVRQLLKIPTGANAARQSELVIYAVKNSASLGTFTFSLVVMSTITQKPIRKRLKRHLGLSMLSRLDVSVNGARAKTLTIR